MNRKDRAVLVGMVLGDSYIKTKSAADKLAGRHPAAQICLGHSVKQKVYAQYKLDILNKMFKGKATLRFGDTTSSDGKKHGMCYANKSNPYFKTLKGIMYSDGVKIITKHVLEMLTPEGIAIWFMDDGSHRKNHRSDGSVSSASLTISTYCSKQEIEEIIAYFLDKHDICFKPAFDKRRTKDQEWYIRTNTAHAKRLAALIGKYIIPSMQYKIACVHNLTKHERQTPDKICVSCGVLFAALKSRGMCMNCYNRKYFDELSKSDRHCSVCDKTKNAKWFVGDVCRACYQQHKRAMI